MIKIIVFLILTLGTFATCNLNGEAEMRGKIVYSSGGKSIKIINMSTLESDPTVIYQSSFPVSAISRITKVNNNIFLFDECSVSGNCTIKQYNFKAKKAKILSSGRLPTYVPFHDMVFFYDMSESGQWLLFSSPLTKLDVRKEVAMAPDKRTLNNQIKQSVIKPVISISRNEVVFIGRDNQLWIHNILDNKMIKTNITNFSPIAWRKKTKQLLCEEYDTGKVYLVDINRRNKTELSGLEEGHGYLYIPEYDALVFGRARFRMPAGEEYEIFSYLFEEKKEKNIISNTHIRSGIYYEEK